MNSLNTFKCSIRKRDLSEVMEDGGCKGCYLCNSIQLSPEGEVNSGGLKPRREVSRYISSAVH